MSHLRLRLITAVAALIAFAGFAVSMGAAPAAASTSGVVISEFRARGPMGGNDEFVELRNAGAAPVDISGWLLQGCASGTPGTASTRATVGAGVVLAPGQSYLFANNNSTGGYSGTVAPDQTYGTGITDFATTNFAGVQVVTAAGKQDGVGAPNSPCREGTGYVTPSTNGENAFERLSGTQDTENNLADFEGPKVANPQNLAFVPPPPPPPIGACNDDLETRISAIQGPTSASPLVGTVRVIEGVVVGDFQGSTGLDGYFVQEEDADADADPLSSEGIFAFDPDAPALAAGDVVRVRGAVSEGFGLTQLTNVDAVVVCSSGASVTSSSLSLPIPSFASLEQFEGMLTTFAQTLTATETFTLGRFGEVSLSAGGRLYNPTHIVAPGAAAAALQEQNNRSRIQLDDNSNVQNPPVVPYIGADNTLRIGDTVAGLTGVLSFGFGTYRVQPTAAVSFTRTNPRPTGPPAVGGSLRVAGANVLNYFTTLDTGPAVCGPTGGLDCRGANDA